MAPVVEVANLGSRDELCILRGVMAKELMAMTEDQPVNWAL